MSPNPNFPPNSLRQWVKRRPGLALASGILLAAIAIYVARNLAKPPPVQTAYHTVKRGDLLISVIEGGALRAVNESIIRSDFEGLSRIISIVPEGTYVKKGDLLVELDSSELRDRVNTQEVNYQNSEFAYVQAKENLSIQKSLIESQIKEAELRVEFARSDLEKYKEGDAPLQRKNTEASITLIEEDLQRAQDMLNWTEVLHKKGYASKSQLEADSLGVKRLKLDLEREQENLRLMIKYDQPKSIRRLESALEQAQMELERLKQRTAAQISQNEADLRTRQKALELTLERLNEQKKVLASARIVAPQDGLVVYASSGDFRSSMQNLIEEGATVRQRQEIIKLPDTSQMLVEVRVHESHVLQIQTGLEALVTVDSIPDRQFKGKVRKVAVLPNSQSSWSNPNLKVYSTEVLIEEPLPDLKPGVSARAEIIVTNLQAALTVPIQSVTTVKGHQVCFVDRGGTATPVSVGIGFFNEQFIEIKAGLKEGDRVLLSPPEGGDNVDFGGSVLALKDLEPRLDAPKAPAARNSNENGSARPTPAANTSSSAPAAGPGAQQGEVVNGNGGIRESRTPGPRLGGGSRGGEGRNSADTQKAREEFMKLSPEEREARMQQWRGRRGPQQGEQKTSADETAPRQ